MRDYDDLREMLYKELDDLYDETAKKGGVNAADLDAIRDITSAIKNTYKIEMFEGGDYSRGRQHPGHLWPGEFLCAARHPLCAGPLQPWE